MVNPEPPPPGGSPDASADLTSLLRRVEALEREVAALRGEAGPMGAVRESRLPLLQPLVEARAMPPLAEVRERGEAESMAAVSGEAVGAVGVGGAARARSVGAVGGGVRGEGEVRGGPGRSLEDRIGSQVFNRVGVVALLIGTAWFLKLAIDNEWIGAGGRILAGLLAGAGIILWSERFRGKGFAAFSYSLKAVGTGVLYLTLWAAFHLYHLLPAPAAFVAMLLIMAWNGWMAWAQDAELLAAYALIGGFMTPGLLSSGQNHEVFLFSYVLALDAGTVLLVRLKGWPRLLATAFPATVGYFIAWYAAFFNPGDGTTPAAVGATSFFVVALAAVFAAASVFYQRGEPGEGRRDGDAPEAGLRARRPGALVHVGLMLGNAAFCSLALYSILEDDRHHNLLPWMLVVLAAVYLGLVRLQRSEPARAVHLAVAVIFLTVAIPLKASSHTLTTAWLVEGLVLFWVSFRMAEAGSARLLRVLAAGGYGLGLASLAVHFVFLGQEGFFSGDLAAALVAVGALGGAAVLGFRSGEEGGALAAEPGVARSRLQRLSDAPALLVAVFMGLDFVAMVPAARELGSYAAEGTLVHPAFRNAEFWTAVVGLGVLAGASWGAWWVSVPGRQRFESCRGVAGATMIAFHLVAILAVEREIGALWSRAEANVQRSLAVSAFLMLYGAVLLAAGFWRRSAFVRWQALGLLVFTIAKTFLYDTRSLAQGYRVVSFLLLGGLLMAISFAYQKDWLGLRETVGADETGGGQ